MASGRNSDHEGADMKKSVIKALYITFGIIMLTLTIQETASAREMQRITPEQIQKLDRAMAIETVNGRFLDISTAAHIKKTFGNVEELKKLGEIKLKDGGYLNAGDIRYLYVERLKAKKAKKLEVGRTPHDEE